MAERLRYPAVAFAGLRAAQPFSTEKGAWAMARFNSSAAWNPAADFKCSLFEAEQAVEGDLRLAPLEAPLAVLVRPFRRAGPLLTY